MHHWVLLGTWSGIVHMYVCNVVHCAAKAESTQLTRQIACLVRTFWSMSPWVADTVWSLSRILSVSQSTCSHETNTMNSVWLDVQIPNLSLPYSKTHLTGCDDETNTLNSEWHDVQLPTPSPHRLNLCKLRFRLPDQETKLSGPTVTHTSSQAVPA